MPRGYELLESKLGHVFQDQKLLENALVHKSYINENQQLGLKDNERLEFLGDAVLDLVVGHLIMDHLPNAREGELSMMRAAVVNEGGVAEVGASIGLGEWLFLGRGEENTGGRRKPSLLADAMEAVIAAVYMDGGFAAAYEMVKRLFLPRIAQIQAPPGFADFKTRLQERAQALKLDMPKYEVTMEQGPDHAKYFEVEVSIAGKTYALQGGRSKKEAEQRAAAAALWRLETEGTTGEPK